MLICFELLCCDYVRFEFGCYDYMCFVMPSLGLTWLGVIRVDVF